jgi:hypothetical protein
VNHEEVLVDDIPAESEEPVEADTPAETPEEPSQETPEDFDWEKTDPNKLPPEVQKYYKGMQASYTRKMQGLSQALDGLKSHSTRLQLLDRAMAGDPEAQEQLSRFIQKRPESAPDADRIPDEFADTKQLVSYFDARVQKALQAAMQQIGQQFAPIQQQVAYREQMAEYEATKAKYPDFDNYIPQMVEIRNQMPGLTLEAAYKLATYKNPVSPQKIVSKPGARPSAVKPRDDGKPMTFEEAAAAAIKHLKKGG